MHSTVGTGYSDRVGRSFPEGCAVAIIIIFLWGLNCFIVGGVKGGGGGNETLLPIAYMAIMSDTCIATFFFKFKAEFNLVLQFSACW